MISDVHNTDCVEFMRSLPDNSFELAIADPPYGILSKIGGKGGKLKDRIIVTDAERLAEWDKEIPKQEFFDELFRVSKNQIIWGGNYFPLPPTRCIVCWDKVQPWENFSQIELAWTSFDYPAKLFRFDNRWAGKFHPTMKPVELYEWLLRNFAKEGDRIFDPMMGSGSSRVAAYKMGFDYTGCELNAEYFQKSGEFFEREALEAVRMKDGRLVQQLTLF